MTMDMRIKTSMDGLRIHFKTYRPRMFYSLLILMILCVTPGYTEDTITDTLASCRESLGMETGDIPDTAISSSSAFDEKSVGPLNSRIRTERNGGAWCPKAQIAKDVYEYLQIDLGKVKVVTLVETQGRFGNGQGLEFAPHYKLEYQRQEGDEWKRYIDHHGEEILEGNLNTYLAEARELHPPIIAQRVRFIPHSVHPRTICMRVELHGCRGQGLVSYSMPQGGSRGTEVDLYDLTYDGKEEDNYLSGGLGQLTDGDLGTWNFRLDIQQTGHKGYQWIGWRNDSVIAEPIDIIFHFDELRNISSVTIHCNNLFSKDIRVFRRAEVYTSVGGLYFDAQPVIYDYYRDDVVYHARNVTIPIPHLVAKYVKLRLHFDSRWMLISEVTFDSVPVDNTTIIELEEPQSSQTTTTTTTVKPTSSSTTSTAPPIVAVVIPRSHSNKGSVLKPEVPPMENNVPRDEKIKPTSKRPIIGSTQIPIHNQPHHHANMDDAYIGVIIGTLTAVILLLAGLAVYFMMRRRRKDYSHTSLKVFTTDDLTYIPSAKLANGNVYNAVATAEQEYTLKRVTAETSLQCRKLPEPPNSVEVADNEANSSRDYASPELSRLSALVVSLPPSPIYQTTVTPSTISSHHHDNNSLSHPHVRAMTAAADPTSIQSWSGNSMYAVPNAELIWQEELNILEFPRHVLKFVEKLGHGRFGEIHLCEMDDVDNLLPDDVIQSLDQSSRSLMVAVKILRQHGNTNIRADFHQELKILSRLKDPNIVRVLGVCTQGEPLAVVMEYMKYGDLHQFLSMHVLDMTLNQHKKANLLSYGCLIYMATQIASGMKYLETLNMVHRDLATRNCLVGHLYSIKISDFGMSRSQYSADYYSIDGKAVLPIRWMAWESVLLDKFSCKSDVWSFAVTLWEVLTFARERPFSSHSDDQILDNCNRYYHGNNQQLSLPQPPNCPKEIHDLMMECCHRDEILRPTFKEIHMFLSRKNMGYDPRDEKPMRYALPYIKNNLN